MLKYKAILAFFLLLSLNSSFLLAEDDSDAESPVVLDDTVSKQTVTSDDVKVDPLSLRPRGKWTHFYIGAEHLDMQGQFIDVLVTASQKALGGPPGLSIVLATERAMTQCRSRGYYFSWKHWLPIMLAYEQQRPSYFATPPVPLIFALHAALKCIPDDFVVRHSHTLDLLHPLLRSYGCSLLTTAPAHTLTAFYLPGSIAPTEFLSAMRNQGIIVAGGIYPGIQHKYIRIGHMGISVTHPDKKHLKRLLEALKIVFDGFGLNPN
ncbi:hypothetical protein HMI56_000385 [Coelomomyces lativittatus]|nr:hypothetical protein HMI56_000385 [Coelomomyces lativittatus]